MVEFVAGRGAGFGEREVGVVAARKEEAWLEGWLLFLLLLLIAHFEYRVLGVSVEELERWSGLDINKMPGRGLPKTPHTITKDNQNISTHEKANAII